MARNNFGFEKVERLQGNIGYLDLRGFMEAQWGSETAVAAMNFLANTDALIIDLRQNGGGDPAMVALITSYLFSPGEEVHLNDLYWRPSNETHQWWTLPYVPGRRYANKPVYVLTSNRTFSAAEEFTYNLKNLKRATIIGETTGGGAHPGGMERLSEHFMAFLPSGRAINPISKTNWEGTGVTPDVAVPAADALTTATAAALRKISESAPHAPGG
ncbi:MAG: S41 family peptidase [Acidobacteriota bacterium]|nr:S41 family peptidase [Acidobacteriota bacterium]